MNILKIIILYILSSDNIEGVVHECVSKILQKETIYKYFKYFKLNAVLLGSAEALGLAKRLLDYL